MSNNFAKVFDTEIGQILVKKDVNEDDLPEVRYYFQPDGLGICSVAVSAKDDSDESFDGIDELFENTNAETAIKAVMPSLRLINGETE